MLTTRLKTLPAPPIVTDARRRLLQALAGGGLTAHELGRILYPTRFRGATKGGPTGWAAAASWQLGKLERATRPNPWVVSTSVHLYGRYYKRGWCLTVAGRRALRIGVKP